MFPPKLLSYRWVSLRNLYCPLSHFVGLRVQLASFLHTLYRPWEVGYWDDEEAREIISNGICG